MVDDRDRIPGLPPAPASPQMADPNVQLPHPAESAEGGPSEAMGSVAEETVTAGATAAESLAGEAQAGVGDVAAEAAIPEAQTGIPEAAPVAIATAAAPVVAAAAPEPPAPSAPVAPSAPAAAPPAPPQAAPTYSWDQPTEPAGPAPGIRFAGHPGRLVAYIVDGIILGVAATVVFFVLAILAGALSSAGSDTAAGLTALFALLATFLVSIGYFPFFWARSGSTPGMRLFRLRVVRDRDGGPIGWGTAILRLVGLWISFAVFYLGVIWILIDSRRRGWHDLLAGTCVIEQG